METQNTNQIDTKGTQFKNSDVEPLFGLAKIEDKIRVVLGNNIITTEEFETFEDAENYIKEKPYELIFNASILLYKFTQEQEKPIKKTKKLCNK